MHTYSSIPTITVTPRKWALCDLWFVYSENNNDNTVDNLLFVLSFETGSHYGVSVVAQLTAIIPAQAPLC